MYTATKEKLLEQGQDIDTDGEDCLPEPLPLGCLLITFATSVSDHAPNEKAKVHYISEKKLERSAVHRAAWRSFGFVCVDSQYI